VEEQLYWKFYEIEKSHWWFVARQRILLDIIQKRIRLPGGSRVLDVGCGTGAVLEELSQHYDTYGTDSSQLAIDLCRERGLQNAYHCTLESFPHRELRFDLVTLLDVIEHIDDDVAILRQAHTFLKPKGCVLVTVPAYQFLWSRHDVVNRHKRRYLRSQVRRVLEESGFRVEMISYFNTFLFPAALVARLAERLFHPEKDTTLDVPAGFLNSLLASLFASERHVLRRTTLPYGLSVVGLARKSG